jgi:hypothetical protein
VLDPRGRAPALENHVKRFLRILEAIFSSAALLLQSSSSSAVIRGDADSDAVFVISYLFLGEPPPQLPYPICGPDPTGDALLCDTFAACKPFHALHSETGMTFICLPPGEFEMGSPPTERGHVASGSRCSRE